MGIKDIVAAFNAISEPGATCDRAKLAYEHSHDTEWQILTFYGTKADGMPFEIRADPVRPGDNILQAARETATRFVNQGKASA